MKIINRLMLLGIIAVALTGCGGNKKLVANGYLEIDKSITIKQALEGYRDFEHVEWQEVETENGKQLVQINCTLSDSVADYYRRMSSTTGYANVKEMAVCFQFLINHDNTFDLSYMGYEIINGTQIIEEAISNSSSKLQKIYNNRSWL